MENLFGWGGIGHVMDKVHKHSAHHHYKDPWAQKAYDIHCPEEDSKDPKVRASAIKYK